MAPRLLASVSTILVLGLQGAAIAADVAEPTQPVEAPIVEVEPNWYIAARLGAAFPLDTDWSLLGGAVNVSNEYDTGWVGGLAVGTQFDVGGFRPRAEIEVGYMRSDIDRHVIDGVPIAGPDAVGHTGVLYGLVNGYLDFGPGPLKPYVGAGLGIGHAEFQDQGVEFAWRHVHGRFGHRLCLADRRRPLLFVQRPGDGRAGLSLFQRGGCLA